ncbi:LytTR family transcriptional regulator [Luteimonas sp. SJ-92]|uniref:LytTR family transcriptional regulator n=1 Tax=Luteimonas salinisoli TaxID=2752307 RepID=A0A853JAB8_9GAMM|nr:LytTR family DNA-binding domain-containing protein [Luteimonas salinisoli]NZA25570.1 LytTR family transcriptional regulator [Luteimonas salinisoli]
MTQPPADAFHHRFQPWRRTFEIGFWIVLTLVNATGNSLTVLMDVERLGLGFSAWEPALWEWSSGLAWLATVPLLVWFTRRFPLHWEGWRRLLRNYLLASVVFSVLHVLGMVAIRIAVYRAQGLDYDFQPWLREFLYEYTKDVRTFFTMVLYIEGYRLLLRRWQGEASLLSVPDEGQPIEAVDRPERFLVRKLGREFLVAAADIEWAQASGNYVNLRVKRHDYPLRSTIGGIEAKLDPHRFVRIHRSYLVNLGQVLSIEPLESGDARVHLRDATVLPCSRRYRADLRARMGAVDEDRT